MTRLDQLLINYRRHVALPLRPNLPLGQRVWFLVYPPEEERRLLLRIEDFHQATLEAQLGWQVINLKGSLALWLDSLEAEEREALLKDQPLLEDYASTGLRDFLAKMVQAVADKVGPEQAPRTVFALTGLMEIYDLVGVSDLLDALTKQFTGNLALFFPGEKEGNSYRFLNARTAWDYLAVPILSEAS